MKFPKFHHERILELISINGFRIEDFFLVKRRGWIRVEYLHSEDFFTYFKKKETNINPETREWENLVYFRIKTLKEKEIIETSFDRMMELFDKWLKALN